MIWLPLNIAPPVKPAHLQAALTSWFDLADQDLDDRRVAHRAQDKPYTISPLAQWEDQFGAWIALLTDSMAELLLEHYMSHPRLRLGKREVEVGQPVLAAYSSWEELANQPPMASWRVEFESPTVFRTRGKPTLLPTPPNLLRSPRLAWQAWSGIELPYDPAAVNREVRVVEAELRTVELPLPRGTTPAIVGSVSYVCDSPKLAEMLAPLLALAPYCGVGSNKTSGMGAINIEPVESLD